MVLNYFFLSESEVTKNDAEVPDAEVDTELELETKKWRFRRAMAFKSFNCLLLLIFVPIVGSATIPGFADDFNKVSEFAAWGLAALASIPGAYMGFSTWSDVHKKPTPSA